MEKLLTLLQQRDLSGIEALIREQPALLDEKDANGRSGLMLLAYSGLGETFDKILQYKTDFSFFDAIIAGKPEIVSAAIKSNPAQINGFSEDGFTPIALAVYFGRTDIARLLANAGADPNIPAQNPSKVNALHAAVARNNVDLCSFLLDHGADPNATQMQHVTPLHSAAHRGNLALVKLLVEKGATVSATMDNGDTALSIAKRDGHGSVAEYLEKSS